MSDGLEFIREAPQGRGHWTGVGQPALAQIGPLGWIEAVVVAVSEDMGETSEFVQERFQVRRKHRWPQGRQVQEHLRQQFVVPAGQVLHMILEGPRNLVEGVLQSVVDVVQVVGSRDRPSLGRSGLWQRRQRRGPAADH